MKKKVSIIIIFIIILLLSGCNVSTIPTDNTAKYLYNSLEKAQVKDNTQKPTLSINKEKLELILSQIKRPSTYTWDTQIIYTSNNKKIIYNGKQYLYQNKIRSEKYNENFRLLQFSLYLNNTSYFIDNQTKEYSIFNGEKPYYPDIFLNISNPLAAIKANNLDNVYNITIDYLNNESVIYFEIRDTSLSLYEKYWVSLKTGIPLRIESYFLGGATYLMTTTGFWDQVTNTSIFKVPTYIY